MRIRRFPLLVATIALALVALSGCGRSAEPVDSSSPETTAVPQTPLTETTPPAQTALSTETRPSIQTTPSKPGWMTDYEQGQQEAKANNKLVLLDFTGSDWCGWCILLDREIFSKPKFKEYASKNLVLVEVDFPKTKPVPTATRKENERLAMKFQIQAFPTIIVLNSDGKVIGELGYMRGGPDAFIAVLERLRKG